MGKIYLNILGIKNFNDDDLKEIYSQLEKINIEAYTLLYEPFEELKRKIGIEQNKRERRNWVWVEFTCSWSGYSNNPSAPRRDIGKIYRKISKDKVDKIGSYYCHRFSDNSTNDWYIKKVSVRGKDTGAYAHQIDDYLKTIICSGTSYS